MIKSLQVKGLHNRFDFDLSFHSDLNIITGKNGSSKTSILKLIWYLLSGHIDFLLEELTFNKAKLLYDNHSLEVVKTALHNNLTQIEVVFDEVSFFRATLNSAIDERDIYEGFGIAPREDISTIFFPTFRRIEGGFTVGKRSPRNHRPELQRALLAISDRLNTDTHKFITSVSTSDIRLLLNNEYNNILEVTSETQSTFSQEIIQKLRNVEEGHHGADSIVKEVKSMMEDSEKKKKEMFKPFDTLSDLVIRFLKHKGIVVSSNITFGEAANALGSDKLSSGEKQLLSFLSYNAFNKNSHIFIDEPELSLHVDWQRELLPALISQNTGNQFFIATHSPFIYGKYPDKEIELITQK